MWRKQDKPKDKTKKSTKQYAQFERPSAGVAASQPEENGSGVNQADDSSVVEGNSSKSNNNAFSD